MISGLFAFFLRQSHPGGLRPSWAKENAALERVIYANGDSVSYSYDILSRKAHTTTSDGDAYHYRYTGEGQLFELEDEGGNLRFRYLYDSIGRLIGSSMKDGDTLALRTWHQYDANNRLTMQRWSFPNIAYSTNYKRSTGDGSLCCL